MSNLLDFDIGLLDRKFILNIKTEGNFASYAKVARRLLCEDRAPLI